MRFGGHETFALREGWLHKGLVLLQESPERLVQDDAADWLGVGRNMAKSIRHWLLATGLAQQAPASHTAAPGRLHPTELGHLVFQQDPYFSASGTWWALHINLVNTPEHAASWTWFFNHFTLSRFERAVCIESLHRHLQVTHRHLPSLKTLHRDIACLLQSYARTLPAEGDDPEEGRECPLTELGLLSYFRTTGHYQMHQGLKDLPPHLLGYAVARGFPEAQSGTGTFDLTIHDAARQPCGPGRVLVLTSETLFELALQAEHAMPGGDIQIASLASERVIRVRKQPPLLWLQAYYDAMAQRERDAA